jgi:hypothetical protein
MYHFNLKKERKEAERQKKKGKNVSTMSLTHLSLKDFELLQTLGKFQITSIHFRILMILLYCSFFRIQIDGRIQTINPVYLY